MRDYESDSTSGLTYFISGAVLGAVVALLFAPKAGEETRKDLTDFLETNREKGRGLVNKVMDKIPARVKGAAAMGAVKEGTEAGINEVKDRLS